MAERRPIATRDLNVSRRLAGQLVAWGWSPNGISIGGMIAGVLAGGAFWATAHYPGATRVCFVLGALLVQVRLLANMFDGMVAVATEKTSPVGELYNEVPDRISDVAVLLGLGYGALGSIELGWAASVAAVFTAYVRVQVKVAGAPQDFIGPVAKPQRMFLVTLTALFCAIAPVDWQVVAGHGLPAICLFVVAVGSAATGLRRLLRGARALRGAS